MGKYFISHLGSQKSKENLLNLLEESWNPLRLIKEKKLFPKRNSLPDEEEVVQRATDRLYSDIIMELNDAHNRGRIEILKDLEYIPTNWEVPSFPPEGKLSNTVMKWIYPSRIHTVSYLEKFTLLKTNVDHSSAVNGNENRYGTFLKECDDRLLSIRHDVIIKIEGNENQEKTIPKVINSLEICNQQYLKVTTVTGMWQMKNMPMKIMMGRTKLEV